MLKVFQSFLITTFKNTINLISSWIFKKVTDNESSVIINNERTDQNNISKEITSHQISVKLIDHERDDNGTSLVNTYKELYVKSIHSINATNDISMNDNDNYIHKYYVPFYHQRTMKIFLQDQNIIQQNKEFIIIKHYYGFIIIDIKEFECQVSFLFLL